MVSKFYELAKVQVFTHETTLNRGRRNQGNPLRMPGKRPGGGQIAIKPGIKRPAFTSSSILSYTENDLAIMAKFAGNGKMAFAQQLFEEMTEAELKLQDILQSDRFKATPCYPQTIAFGYILDFYLPTVGLAIEADGPIHLRQEAQDKKRDRNLKVRGITTLRIKNHDIILEPEKTIRRIEAKIAALQASRA